MPTTTPLEPPTGDAEVAATTAASRRRAGARRRSWSRVRMQTRSVISAILPVGWTWVAVNALIPYFWGDHGPGTSELTILGITRATWTSMHVWTSIGMTILTIVHVVLNRKGVARSYKLLGGTSGGASDRIPSGAASAKKRSWAWVPALALSAAVFAGGVWFASVDGEHTGNDSASGNGRGAQLSTDHEDGVDSVDGEDGDARATATGGGYQGGRNPNWVPPAD